MHLTHVTNAIIINTEENLKYHMEIVKNIKKESWNKMELVQDVNILSLKEKFTKKQKWNKLIK